MKNNFMKKALALMTSIITVSAGAVSINTVAVDSPTQDSLPAVKLTTSSTTAEIPVTQDILLFNSENKRIWEPNIVYSYSVTSANVTNANIKTEDADDNEVILSVHPGVIGAITEMHDSGDASKEMTVSGEARIGTATFGTSTFGKPTESLKDTNKLTVETVEEGGEEVRYNCSIDCKARQQMKITVDASEIYDTNKDGVADNAPGVYRYKIEDITEDSTFAEAGVTKGSASDEIFLDVYTKYNDDQSGLVIYGYVMLRSGLGDDNTSITYNQSAEETVKIDGYTTTSEGDTNGDELVLPADYRGDCYYTYNIDVKKQVTGDLADRTHEFPFQIQLSNGTIKNSADFSVNDGRTHFHTSLNSDGNWDSSGANMSNSNVDFKLKHEEMISLIGLPKNTAIMVTETNDTNDVYSVSASFNGNGKPVQLADETSGNSVSVVKGGTAKLQGDDNAPLTAKTNSESDKVVFINTLRDVSVTGLLMNIAPFLFITAFGVLLLVLYMRNKKNERDDNII